MTRKNVTKILSATGIAAFSLFLASCGGESKSDADMSKVVFDNAVVTYDGKAKSLEIKNVPDAFDYNISITNSSGKSVKAEEVIDADTYKFTATFSVKDDKYNVPFPVVATLTIEKATYDMSGVVFENLNYTYDGQKHAPTIKGLPEGVTSSIKLYAGNSNEPVDSVSELGAYRVVASFVGQKNYNPIPNKEAVFTIGKATYDLSNVKITGLQHVYDGEAHKPIVSDVPAGVTATTKLYREGSSIALDEAVLGGNYRAVVSFVGDGNHNLIQDIEKDFVIAKASEAKTLLNAKAESRIFNINDTAEKKPAVIADLEGSTPVFSYKDKQGNPVANINEAPVGEYDCEVSFDHPNYPITNKLQTKVTITNRIVKNLVSYQDLVDMAEEVQENYTLFEGSSDSDPWWYDYNGGNPEDRWSNKVAYQLLTDIDCGDQVWKAAGWDVGFYLDTEEVIDTKGTADPDDDEEWRSIKGTSEVDPVTGEVINPGYVVNHPRQDGPKFYGFGYLSVYLDGNGHSIKNFKLNNSTHTNDSGDNLGQYPDWVEPNQSSYLRSGLFVSSSYSTYKNIVFDNPTMTLDDTATTVVWAGFINATEGYNNTYEGLTFNNPVMNVNCKKANVGTLAGITLVLANDRGGSAKRGNDYLLDRPEEMIFTIQDVAINNCDYTFTGISADRISVGGLYGESQCGWWTFNIDNYSIDGDIRVSGGTSNNAGDIFGMLDAGKHIGGNFEKSYNGLYTFNVSNSEFDVVYTIPANIHLGTDMTGDAYHKIELTSETYEANVYYRIPAGSTALTLADGAFDANEIYFEKGTGTEDLNTTYIYFKGFDSSYVGLLNEHLNVDEYSINHSNSHLA